MRALALAVSAALLLTGCQTIQTVEDAVQKNLPQACTAIASAHAAFVIINAAHPLPVGVVNKESAAMAAVATICADPAHVTAANALIVAAQAYSAVAQALREAEKVEGV